MKTKFLLTGNEACAEGAIYAGCKFYAGYPITPQNELIAHMSRRVEEMGGVFIQSESELSAINMVFGASVTGARAMTSSSSPGVSLMQEGISYITACELPAVIVNVMRGGPGLGNIGPSQADYFQSVKGGGHGDYRLLVLAPATVQEMFDMTYDAFTLADRYRNPVMILADGMLGQMMEPLEFDTDLKPVGLTEKPWALTGAKGRPAQSIHSLLLAEGALERHNQKLHKKYIQITEKEVRVESYKAEDAEIILVAYGTVGRIARECVEELSAKGMKIGLIRPQTLWPFPSVEIAKHSKKKQKFLVVEMSMGQMVEDVRLAVQDDARVSFFGRSGGEVPTKEEICHAVKQIEKKI